MPSGSPPPPTRPGALFAVVIACVLFLPLSEADLYLSADRHGALPVNATFISFVGLSSLFSAVSLAGLARDRGRGLCSLYLAAAPPLIAFALLTLVQIGGGFLPDANWLGGGRFIYLPLYGFTMLLFAMAIASSRAFHQYRRVILAICLLGAAGSIFIDVFFPQTFSRLATRPAGFDGNPNHAAMIVVILAIATVEWTRSRAADMLLWFIAGLAVAATLSRGGMILLAVVFLYYSIVSSRTGPRRYMKNLSILLVAVAVTVPLYSLTDLGTTVYSSENSRVQLLATLFSGDAASLTKDPRAELVDRFFDLISGRPILGYGTGRVMTYAEGPHNMFLALWFENGITGLLAYLMVLIVCFSYFRVTMDPRGQAFCMALFIFSFFSHNLLDSRPIYVTLGLLIAMAVSERRARSEPPRSAAASRLARSSLRWSRLTTTAGWPALLPYRRD
jgi:O-antigen ligase